MSGELGFKILYSVIKQNSSDLASHATNKELLFLKPVSLFNNFYSFLQKVSF